MLTVIASLVDIRRGFERCDRHFHCGTLWFYYRKPTDPPLEKGHYSINFPHPTPVSAIPCRLLKQYLHLNEYIR